MLSVQLLSASPPQIVLNYIPERDLANVAVDCRSFVRTSFCTPAGEALTYLPALGWPRLAPCSFCPFVVKGKTLREGGQEGGENSSEAVLRSEEEGGTQRCF